MAAKGSGFVLTASDDDDAPAQRVVTPGATADPVKDYLKQIGKVSLLNAQQEVDLAMRIEAGLYAEHKLADNPDMDPKLKKELRWVIHMVSVRRTTCWKRTCASWSHSLNAIRAAECYSLTLFRKVILV